MNRISFQNSWWAFKIISRLVSCWTSKKIFFLLS